MPYTSSVIGRIYNGSVIQYWRSCTPSRSIGLFLGSARFLGWMPLFAFFGLPNCVLLFDKSLILGCLWPLVFVLNNILILGIWCSTIPHLPGCFCLCTFFQNIGFNTVLTDPFITGAKLDWLTRSLAHPRWRTSEAVSNQGSVRAVAVWVGLLKWDYYFVMNLGTTGEKQTLKILTNVVIRSVRKMAWDGLTSILGWANFVCAPGSDRLTRLGMG